MRTEWQLERYFYTDRNDPRIMEDVDRYKLETDLFLTKFKGRITSLTDDEFLDMLDDESRLGSSIEKVFFYLSLATSLDSQDQELQKMMTKFGKIASDCGEKTTFYDEEMKSVGHERLLSLSEKEQFKPYKNYLVSLANSLKYLLDEPREKLLSKIGAANSDDLYTELTSAFEFDFRGQKITLEEVRAKRESADRSERHDAYMSLSEVFSKKESRIVIGDMYGKVCRNSVLSKELRGYSTVMESRNIGEELSNEVVDALIKNVKDAYPLYHEFLAKKKAALGIEDFSMHDVFAHIGSASSKKFPFDQGWALYLNAIKDVDPKLYEFSKDMEDGGRMSVFPKKGKVGGAYANYTQRIPSFTLLNWTDMASDVTTLAHELGHCFHGMLAKKQKSLVYDTPMTLAETASIFNETIMFDVLMQQDMDEQERLSMVASRLDDIFGTIARQIAFTSFERRCHESFDRNEPLSPDDYDRMWLEEMRELYGSGVNIQPEMAQFGWASIPHIYHTPFYCYSYAFGCIISLNLVQQYRNSGDKQAFLEKYHEFLAAGGSERPEDLLWRIFGIRMDEKFYAVAFDAIRELLAMIKEPVVA